ncbi:hypothetical protein GQ600_12006 [Phytophthora cactorum]|nr:hypothetical protein GQ600_12006 [Phytophthora cactorum]
MERLSQEKKDEIIETALGNKEVRFDSSPNVNISGISRICNHMVSSYADAAWFKAYEGYLVFCLWLLDRCYALSDVATPQSEKACHRVFLWFMLLLHEILKYMGGKLLTLRLELQAESEDPNLGVGGELERDVVAEVVEMATELLMSRATKEDMDALCQWLGILTLEGDAWEIRSGRGKPEMPQTKHLYPSIQEEQKVEIPTISSEVEKLWTSELQQLQKLSSDEEEKRQEVARGIEAFLRYDVGKWPECKVEVFASSMSMFGSPDSDLDTAKRRKNDLFDLKSIFESEGFEVDTVVLMLDPGLRFRYSRSGPTTTYASFDERARDLGIAVKHWAKQRGVSDTSSGFLSSYSYVLMSIYYLQVVNVLPNLQDPPLVQMQIPPVEHHNKSIAFCEDREIAKIYHEKSIHEGELVDKSLPTLLLDSSSSTRHNSIVSITSWLFDHQICGAKD